MRRLLAPLILALALTPLFQPPALASAAIPSTSSGGFICATSGSNSNVSTGDSYLPINRWGSVSGSEFTNLPGGIIGSIESAPQQITRGAVGMTISTGNALWGATSALTGIAEKFCFAEPAAASINSITTTIWNFVSQGYVVVLLLVASFVALLVRLRKKLTGGLHELVRIAVVVGLAATLGIQASKTTTASANSGVYPVFSPAWIVTTLYNAITTVVAAPLAGIATATSNVQLTGSSLGTSSGVSCPSYINSLFHQYSASFGNGAGLTTQAVVPEMISNIWDSSGLQAASNAQFGDNQYATDAYCHLYEQEAGIPSAAQLAIAKQAGPLPAGATASSLAFLSNSDNTNLTVASIIGWAACTSPNSTQLGPFGGWSALTSSTGVGSSSAAPGRAGVLASGTTLAITSPPTNITHADCVNWWTSPGYTGAGTGLDMPSSASAYVAAAGSHTNVINFLGNFFGNTSNGAEITSIVYALSSLVVLVTFGAMALAVIVAKFGLLLLLALFIIFLVVDIFPGNSGRGHSHKFVRQGASFMLLAIGAEAILGMVALLTNVIDRFGTGAIGTGLAGMLWIAISPVAAIWCLHYILKTFKVPSPFRPDAAMGWAAAAGAGGFVTGALGEKLTGRWQRHSQAAQQKLGSSARKGGRSLVPKAEARIYGPRGSALGRSGLPSRFLPNTDRGGVGTGTGAVRRRVSTSGTPVSGSPAAQAVLSNGLPAVSPAPKSQRILNRLSTPAPKHIDKDGVKYRSPFHMRLEGTQRAAEARKQRAEAKQWIKDQRPQGAINRIKTASTERAQLAYARFQADPRKALLKAAAYAGTAAILPASAPVVAGIVGGHYAVTKIRTAIREHPYRVKEKQAEVDYVARQLAGVAQNQQNPNHAARRSTPHARSWSRHTA